MTKEKFVVLLTILGMVASVLGLVVIGTFEMGGPDIGAACGIPGVGGSAPAVVATNAIWGIGAALLVFSALLKRAELLVVLEVFAVISAAMSFWHPALGFKLLSRLGMSALAVLYLKRRKLLPGYTFFWPPRAWKDGDAAALALGLEMLGVGYALSPSNISMWLITLGCVFLTRSSWVAWKATQQWIFNAWVWLNAAYTLGGTVILIARAVR